METDLGGWGGIVVVFTGELLLGVVVFTGELLLGGGGDGDGRGRSRAWVQSCSKPGTTSLSICQIKIWISLMI